MQGLKDGPCAATFLTAFTCFHRSRALPKGCDCLRANLAFAVSRCVCCLFASANASSQTNPHKTNKQPTNKRTRPNKQDCLRTHPHVADDLRDAKDGGAFGGGPSKQHKTGGG